MAVQRYYPIDLLRCGMADWRVEGGSIEGLRSIAGDTPDRLGTGRGGLWVCDMAEIMIETREEKVVWRGLRAQMRNGGLPIIVPLERLEWFAQPLRDLAAPVPYGDGAFHSDGSGFADKPIAASVSVAAELGEIEISILVAGAEPFIGAEPFTIVHGRAGVRLYEVAGVLDAQQSANGTLYRLEINPPLRDDVAVGMDVDFNDPRCEMRLAEPNGMPFPEEVVTIVSARFIEDHRALASPPSP